MTGKEPTTGNQSDCEDTNELREGDWRKKSLKKKEEARSYRALQNL